MTWTTPVTQANGHVVTPTEWNSQVVGNLLDLRAAVTVVVAGSALFPTGTLGCAAPFAGTYFVEFGAGSIDTVTTASTLQLVSDQGGVVTYSDTGPGGGVGVVAGAVLAASQVVTVTCSSIAGSASASLIQVYIKLTRTA